MVHKQNMAEKVHVEIQSSDDASDEDNMSESGRPIGQYTYKVNNVLFFI